MTRFHLVPLFAFAGLLAMSVDSQACPRGRIRVVQSYGAPVVHTYYSAPAIAPPPGVVHQHVQPSQTNRPVSFSVSAPQVVVDRRPEIRVGTQITLKLLYLKNEGGYVFLKHGGVSQRCQVVQWSPEEVVFVVPELEIDDEIPATLEIVRADGEPVKKFEIRLYSSVLIQAPQTLAAGN